MGLQQKNYGAVETGYKSDDKVKLKVESSVNWEILLLFVTVACHVD